MRKKLIPTSIIVVFLIFAQSICGSDQSSYAAFQGYLEKASNPRFRRANSGFYGQMHYLEEKDLLGDKKLELGVPADQKEKASYTNRLMNYWFGNYKHISKTYLVHNVFDDISNAYKDNHYELYVMPKDEYLGSLFNNIIQEIWDYYGRKHSKDYKKEQDKFATQFLEPIIKKDIAFIAIRTTPGITKSPFDGKIMPRIIIGFQPTVARDTAEEIIWWIGETTKNLDAKCLKDKPRYSDEYNCLLYCAYGSADFKDSKAGQAKYKDRKNKAYPDNQLALFSPRFQEIWMPSDDVQKWLNEKNSKKPGLDAKDKGAFYGNDASIGIGADY